MNSTRDAGSSGHAAAEIERPHRSRDRPPAERTRAARATIRQHGGDARADRLVEDDDRARRLPARGARRPRARDRSRSWLASVPGERDHQRDLGAPRDPQRERTDAPGVKCVHDRGREGARARPRSPRRRVTDRSHTRTSTPRAARPRAMRATVTALPRTEGGANGVRSATRAGIGGSIRASPAGGKRRGSESPERPEPLL